MFQRARDGRRVGAERRRALGARGGGGPELDVARAARAELKEDRREPHERAAVGRARLEPQLELPAHVDHLLLRHRRFSDRLFGSMRGRALAQSVERREQPFRKPIVVYPGGYNGWR